MAIRHTIRRVQISLEREGHEFDIHSGKDFYPLFSLSLSLSLSLGGVRCSPVWSSGDRFSFHGVLPNVEYDSSFQNFILNWNRPHC
jgi:hypothetical protein